jgi:serine/threonine-protein kinase
MTYRDGMGDRTKTWIELDTAPQIGKYDIIRQIGKGAMGEVWLAHNPNLDIPVAIKTLPGALIAADPKYVRRFLKEAKTAAKINNSNVVRIYDADSFQNIYYIVMEYVEGGTLSELLESRGGTLPVMDALPILIGVTEGLAAAAERDIVHRDIKPDNIMLTKDGTPKLADLGLSRQMSDAGRSSLTNAGMILGTPFYVAPEQVQDSTNVDARTDLYSLGATFYRAVTGRVPFEGNTPLEIMMAHCSDPLPPPDSINPQLTHSVCAVIETMMEKDPADRYQTPRELLQDLNALHWQKAEVKDLLAGNSKSGKRRTALAKNEGGSRGRSRTKKSGPADPTEKLSGPVDIPPSQGALTKPQIALCVCALIVVIIAIAYLIKG